MKAAAIALTALTLTASAAAVHADEHEAESITEALADGDAGASLRYRYEHVDQDGFADDANASTARLRLNYRTGSYRGWSAFGEFDYVGELFLNDFNSLGGSSPARDRYPVVADPKGPDLNQLYVDYSPSSQLTVRVGRQQILVGNQRFVGAVGWRQNHQTYDGLSVMSKALPNTDLQYSYVTAVRRIFGDNVTAGRNDTDIHLLSAGIALRDGFRLSPYFLYIDNEDVASFSTTTLGARLTGGFKAGEGRVDLVLEVATQSDAADNPVSYDAEYFNVGATWSPMQDFTVGIAWESLGGDQAVSGAAFRTPLATLHAFQGWADKFLATPDAGIDDLYFTLRYRAGAWNLTGVYHDFSAASGSADWGSEIDLSAGRSFAERFGVLLKAAFYDADQFATDTTKFWLMFTAAY